MTICLAVVMCASIGCDSKPTTFDPLEGNWELWREGTIIRKKIEIETGGTTEKRIFILEFKDGVDVKSTRIHEYSKINEGESGRLYCWNGLDSDNTYMWIPDKSVVIAIEEDPISVEDFIANMKKQDSIADMKESQIKVSSIKKQDWNRVGSPPPYHQTVLIKFKDGLTTTAYYTPTKEWKTDINRRKLSGGIALKDVAHWKFIDLE